MPVRETASLDGVWQVRLDPDDRGESDAWWRPDAPFDRALPVPLAWQAAGPELRTYAGVAWYRRSFRVPETWRDRSVLVRFGAVDYEATVWLNGQAVGGHTGGYTPFELDLSAHLDWSADNWLVVRVSDPADTSEIPHGKQGGRWYTSISGPWQSVSLLTRPRQHVARVRCVPDTELALFRVEVACRLESTGRVRVEIWDDQGRRLVAHASAAVTTETPSALLELRLADPKTWSPDSPFLYTLRATLDDGRDVVEQRVGLRTFEARNGQLWLNGQPFYMRAALDQGYWPETLYSPPSDAEIEREIGLAKSMGLNMLRKHIKPEDPRYLDVCDRLGMLIWAEPANPTAFTDAARAALRRDLLEMVARDVNRPSVVIWSLYNEDWGLPGLWSEADRHAWLRELYHELRAIDPTRPICDNSGWAHVLTDLNDYHEYYSLPDRIASFRQRLDFIEDHPIDNYAQGQAPRGGEPVLVSEWGNWALPDPAQARERSNGVAPAWFEYDRAYARAADLPPAPPENPLTERIKTVAGFEDRFAALGLKAVFGTPAALVEHVQQRAFRSLKAHIEEMRSRPTIQGWVVTELSDIEWEANGWLDYWRQPKSFTFQLGDLNADLTLVALPERRTVWGGDPVCVSVWLSNISSRCVDGTLRWRVEGTPLGGDVPAAIGPFQSAANASAIRFTAPDDRIANARLLLELVQGGEVIARADAELTWAPRASGLVPGVGLNGHGLDRVIRQRLERQGYAVPRSFRPELGLAITETLNEETLACVHDGGRVLWLAQDAGPHAERLGLRPWRLPPAESWRMAGGSAWARAERLAPAPILPTLGWEVAEIFPHAVIDVDNLGPDDELLAGWFEGWLANGGALAVRRAVGRGHLLATTFRFVDSYGVEPVATLLLNRLLTLLRDA